MSPEPLPIPDSVSSSNGSTSYGRPIFDAVPGDQWHLPPED
jgi:hypothetical protein